MVHSAIRDAPLAFEQGKEKADKDESARLLQQMPLKDTVWKTRAYFGENQQAQCDTTNVQVGFSKT